MTHQVAPGAVLPCSSAVDSARQRRCDRTPEPAGRIGQARDPRSGRGWSRSCRRSARR